MNWSTFAFVLLAAGAGGCIAVQAVANARLRAALGNPGFATFSSICGTFVTTVVLMIVFVAVWRPPAPAADDLRRTDWWYWIGGPLGVLFVLAGAALVRELGAAAYFALVVAGQIGVSLLLEHYGLMGMAENPITAKRLIGAGLVVFGVVCIKYL